MSLDRKSASALVGGRVQPADRGARVETAAMSRIERIVSSQADPRPSGIRQTRRLETR